MILTNEARRLFYGKGIERLPRKGWSISLLDINVIDIDPNNLCKKNIITETTFDITIEELLIKNKKPLIFPVVKSKKVTYIRSALVKIKSGVSFFLSCSEHNGEINFPFIEAKKGTKFVIDTFCIKPGQ